MTLQEFVKYALQKAEEQAKVERIELDNLERKLKEQRFISENGSDGIFPYEKHYAVVKDGRIVSHEDTKGDAWRAYWS